MKFQVTNLFASNEAIQLATDTLKQMGVSISNLTATWNHIAKKVLQSGVYYTRVPKLKEVFLIIELDDRVIDAPGFKAMELNNMIQRIEAVPTMKLPLGEDKFEQFWNIYPTRNNKKIGKPTAKRLFMAHIKSEEVFQKLLQATDNYAKRCGGYPKDCERFIRNDFWREYLEQDLKTLTSSDIDKMLEN
jgi:hypothetical protein